MISETRTLGDELAVGDQIHHPLADFDVVLLPALLGIRSLREGCPNLLSKEFGIQSGDDL